MKPPIGADWRSHLEICTLQGVDDEWLDGPSEAIEVNSLPTVTSVPVRRVRQPVSRPAVGIVLVLFLVLAVRFVGMVSLRLRRTR